MEHKINTQATGEATTSKVSAVLSGRVDKKHSVRFDAIEGDMALINNIYLNNAVVMMLGNPQAIKVTVEPFRPEDNN